MKRAGVEVKGHSDGSQRPIKADGFVVAGHLSLMVIALEFALKLVSNENMTKFEINLNVNSSGEYILQLLSSLLASLMVQSVQSVLIAYRLFCCTYSRRYTLCRPLCGSKSL